jgi:MOSC domain-containing protein YiiM
VNGPSAKTAKLVSITITPVGVERQPATHYAREAVSRADLIEQRGIDSDLKGKGGARQINLMRAETIAELAAEGCKAAPGELGEQVVISGLPGESFQPGARLRIGHDAMLEIVKPRTGCDRFEAIQGRPRQSVSGRLGVLARVVQSGAIAVGDPVAIVTAVK